MYFYVRVSGLWSNPHGMNSATAVDAYVYGHLAHVLAADLPSQILRPKLARHTNLVEFCARFKVRSVRIVAQRILLTLAAATGAVLLRGVIVPSLGLNEAKAQANSIVSATPIFPRLVGLRLCSVDLHGSECPASGSLRPHRFARTPEGCMARCPLRILPRMIARTPVQSQPTRTLT